MAQVYAQRVESAIQDRGRSVTLQSLALGALWTLLTTIALVLLFVGMNRFFPAAYTRLESWRETRIPSIRIQRLEVISASRLTDSLLLPRRCASWP